MSTLQSWLSIPEDSDFSLYNLPFGIFSTDTLTPRAGMAIGRHIVHLDACRQKGLLGELAADWPADILRQPTLNDLIALGKSQTVPLRECVQKGLTLGADDWQGQADDLLVPMDKATLHLPIAVGDYTDFYSSIDHATNVGKMFRDPDNALLPNWRHLPVGYHGRASSIVVSGTPVLRPMGQIKPNDSDTPVYQPSGRMDFELEMGLVIGRSNKLGAPVPIQEAEDFIFGLVLFNDWSARDIQKWEYVPLGPFLGKSFASTMSPWIVTLEALAPYRVAGPEQSPEVLPYLQFSGKYHYDIPLYVTLQPEGGQEQTIAVSNYHYLYWNMVQHVAHHTVNGCNLRVGDVMASGTISGPDEGSYGSMLEIAWAGQKPVTLSDGSQRVFLQDGDTLRLRAVAGEGARKVGFGEAAGTIMPAVR